MIRKVSCLFFVLLLLGSFGSIALADCDSPLYINYGDHALCQIAVPGEVDLFKFPGEAGDRIWLEVRDGSSWMCSYGVDPSVEIYAPGGGLLYSGSSCEVYILYPGAGLPASGEYTILIYGGVGTYSLALERVSDPIGPEVKYGEHLEDAIASLGEVDLYTFRACEGDLVRLQLVDVSSWMCSYGVDPNVSFFNPDGSLLATGSDCTTLIMQPTIPADGTYSFLVWGREGLYSFDFDVIIGGACIPYGLQANVLLNKTQFTTGDALNASLRITNGAQPVKVDLKAWAELPNGTLMRLKALTNLSIAANSDQTITLLNYTFKGSEQQGTYWMGANLTNPISGKTMAIDQEQFVFDLTP